jgi:hypothetical protein
MTDRPMPMRSAVGGLASLTGRVAGTLLSGVERAADATLDSVLASPRTERLLDRALDHPGLERLIARVLDSRLADHTVEHLLDSDQMDRIVTRIAESPQVREAVASQTASLAGEVAAGVRGRAAAADTVAEGVVQRLLRRRPAPASGDTDDRLE